MSTADDITNRIAAIQTALKNSKLEGWLLYNFRQSNVFATKLLALPSHLTQMRRYFYYIPAVGTPQKLVHGIEQYNLDHLPGNKTVYVSWQSLQEGLKAALRGLTSVAMEYSPNNAIPYVSKVDAGTVDLIRSFGVEVVSSADIVQYFEARWTDAQRDEQFETSRVLRKTVDIAFGFIGERLRQGKKVTEYDVQQRMAEYFKENSLVIDDAPNCSVNANAANPHYEPTKEIFSEIRKGDCVLIDLWAKKDGPESVYSDITWVAFTGENIPSKYQKVFEVVKGARDEAVAYLKKEFSAGRKYGDAMLTTSPANTSPTGDTASISSTGRATTSASRCMATARTSTTSRLMTSARSFPKHVFPSSRAFISRANSAFGWKLTSMFPSRSRSSSLVNRSNRKL